MEFCFVTAAGSWKYCVISRGVTTTDNCFPRESDLFLNETESFVIFRFVFSCKERLISDEREWELIVVIYIIGNKENCCCRVNKFALYYCY